MKTTYVTRLLAPALLALVVSPLSAVEWADNMFPVKTHDFGSVAIAAKTEFRFPFKNLYVEDIHISTVRASCGCTTPIIENHTVKTGETGFILARFNTGSFTGKKGATLTVVIDKPYYAEVQLRVDGYIRKDIVFSPGNVDFGSIQQGRPLQREVNISYAGRDSWQVVDVHSTNPNIKAALTETGRGGGRVSYRMTVAFDGAAPAGPLRTNLVLITNDRAMPRVPLEVNCDVRPAVMVSPQVLALGNLKPGQVAEQRVVVRSDTPFKLTNILAEGLDIQYQSVDTAKKTHVLPLRITAGEKAGKMQQRLIVHTDLPGDLTGSALLAGEITDR